MSCTIILILVQITYLEDVTMIHLIVGSKGKGKTKELLAKAADAISKADGSVVYVDKNKQHMHELNYRIRLINATDYLVGSCDSYTGFISGIISQDHDLQYLFLDSFLTVANISSAELSEPLNKLAQLSDKYNVDMTLSISADESEIPEDCKKYVTVSL